MASIIDIGAFYYHHIFLMKDALRLARGQWWELILISNIAVSVVEVSSADS